MREIKFPNIREDAINRYRRCKARAKKRTNLLEHLTTPSGALRNGKEQAGRALIIIRLPSCAFGQLYKRQTKTQTTDKKYTFYLDWTNKEIKVYEALYYPV